MVRQRGRLMEHTAEMWPSEALPATTGMPRERNSTMVVCDGKGGQLLLDLRCPDVRWLVAACRSLLAGRVPPGASMLKVRAGEEVYVLLRRRETDGAEAVRITNLYNRSESVLLPSDLAELIMSILDRLIAP